MNTKNSITLNTEGRVVLNNKTELCMTYEDYRYIKLLQDYVTEILVVIDKFCTENNIKYYLAEGTLLGAVRHNGFIPWDDDADLLMPREDYERFIKLAKDGLPEGYCIDCPEYNKNYWSIHPYIEMTRKVPYVKQRQSKVAFYNGPCVDIFPLDYVPSIDSELISRAKTIKFLRRVLWIKSGFHTRSWYKTFARRLKKYYPAKIYGMFFKSETIYKKATELLIKTNGLEHNYAAMFTSLYNIKKEVHKAEYFGEPCRHEFEGHQFLIPQNPDKILKTIYGDYSSLPPVEERRSKHLFKLNRELLDKCDADSMLTLAIEDIENFRKQNGSSTSLAVMPKEESYTGIFYFLFNSVPAKVNKNIKKQYKASSSVKRTNHIASELAKHINEPICDNTVLYEANLGKGIYGSPKAIFLSLLNNPKFKDFKHIWAVADYNFAKADMAPYLQNNNIIFVKRNSKEYIKYLSCAKYIISNASLPWYFSLKEGQKHLNLPQTLPSVGIGYEDGYFRTQKANTNIKNLLNTTHIVTMSPDRFINSAYMLNGIYKGKVIKEDSPSADLIVNSTKESANRFLKQNGFNTSKKIILFAPSLIKTADFNIDSEAENICNAVNTLLKKVGEKYTVLLKLSPGIIKRIKQKEIKSLCIPANIEHYEYLKAIDFLITDYSGIFIDYLLTNNPILFYVPNLKANQSNIVIAQEDWPGPVCTQINDICNCILNPELLKDYTEKYQNMQMLYHPNTAGNVSFKVIEEFFNDNGTTLKTAKTKLLIMAEWNNRLYGCTDVEALLKKIDYEKYDVTLLTSLPKKRARKTSLDNLDKRVRIIINNKRPVITKKVKRNARIKFLEKDFNSAVQLYNFKNEWQRLLGGAEFDRLLLVAPKQSIANWLLLSHYAPVKNKTLALHDYISAESVLKDATVFSLFNNIIPEVEKYEQFL